MGVVKLRVCWETCQVRSAVRIAEVNLAHWVGVNANVGDASGAPRNLLSRTSTKAPSKHTSTQAVLSFECDDLNQQPALPIPITLQRGESAFDQRYGLVLRERVLGESGSEHGREVAHRFALLDHPEMDQRFGPRHVG